MSNTKELRCEINSTAAGIFCCAGPTEAGLRGRHGGGGGVHGAGEPAQRDAAQMQGGGSLLAVFCSLLLTGLERRWLVIQKGQSSNLANLQLEPINPVGKVCTVYW